MSSPKPARWFSPSNMLTAVLGLLVVSMLLFPEVKAVMIRGLMKVGLFQPNIPSRSEAPPPDAGIGEVAAFRDAQGRSITLQSLRGKVVLLNFWATWCPPCRAEMPSLDALHRKLAADTAIVILAVDADNAIAQSAAFLRQKGYSIPLAVPDGAIPTSLFSGTLPTTVILDKSGRIVMRETGATDFDSKKLEQFLLQLK